MKISDIFISHLDRRILFRQQNPARLGGNIRHRDPAGNLSVQPQRMFGNGFPATGAHIIDNETDIRLKRKIAALQRAGKRGQLFRFRKIVPNQPFHIIIFSIGMTRIAEAPAAFSFCKVSQNTDS
jgi:hypothetical protein